MIWQENTTWNSPLMISQAFHQIKTQTRIAIKADMLAHIICGHRGQIAHGKGQESLICNHQVRLCLALKLIPAQKQRSMGIDADCILNA